LIFNYDAFRQGMVLLTDNLTLKSPNRAANLHDGHIAAQRWRRRALTPYPDGPGRASSISCIRKSFGRINGDAAAAD
jgi:hypothetical protein